ncbi:MAG: TRAP transporter large permease [Comamonadaceae bacterium]|nr:MAG: TRAP transporter large permease [Comamonadaceae bacterium]
MTVGLFGFAAMLLLLGLGVPVAYAIGTVAIVGIYVAVGPVFLLSTIETLPYAFASDYNFAVVPLFVLMGALASRAGIISDLYTAAFRLTSGIRGSLMMATVMAQAMFAAISGSTTVAASIFTRMALPEMTRHGYNAGVSAGCVAAAGTLAGLIPPSIAMVLYAVLTGEPIGKLLIAGVLPGALTAVGYLVGIRLMLVFRPEWAPAIQERFTWKQKLAGIGNTWSVVLLIALVMGGIYAGVFPPSAAGAVGAAGVLVIALSMRRIKRGDIWESLLESARVSAVLFLIVIAGLLFSRFLLISGFMAELKTLVLAIDMGASSFIALVVVLFLILGCFVDSVSLMVITLPFLYPISAALGVNGIWFGVLVIKLIEIAAITPPVGLNLFAVLAAARGKLNSRELFIGILPFLAMEAVIMGLLIAFPAIATVLPALMD